MISLLLCLYKGEWLGLGRGKHSKEREEKAFEQGLDYTVKYKNVCTKRNSKSTGTKLLFKCKSVTYGLNEDLGRHWGREGKMECIVRGAEGESVGHVLLECL